MVVVVRRGRHGTHERGHRPVTPRGPVVLGMVLVVVVAAGAVRVGVGGVAAARRRRVMPSTTKSAPLSRPSGR